MKTFIVLFLICGLAIAIYIAAGLASTGIFRIPLFSDIFYQKKVADLGIPVRPQAAADLIKKLGLAESPLLPYPPPARTVELTDIELTSAVNLLCQREQIVLKKKETGYFCPFNNFQIKFLPAGFLASAHLLWPIETDITVEGKVARKDEKSIGLEIEKVYLGNVLAGQSFSASLQKTIEDGINKILGQLKYLSIEEITFLEGKVIIRGIFSIDGLLCNLGLKNYCF